jgi:uncharacterized membrane protein (UPF0127 family)
MKFLFDIVVILVCVLLGWYLYQNYWDRFVETFLDDTPTHTIYIGSSAITVTVADTDMTRVAGLSGVARLDEREGKLFIFDGDGRHGIWMKDMLIPLDIIWINKNLEVVHIEEDVSPESYPKVFTPPTDARFVLEMNAHFVSSLRVKNGDRLTIPAHLLPSDIKRDLQQ